MDKILENIDLDNIINISDYIPHLTNIIYEDLENIIYNLENTKKYSINIIKSNKQNKTTNLLSNISNASKYGEVWMENIRELIIYMTKKVKKLNIIEDTKYYVIQVNDETKIKLLVLYLIFFHYDARSYKTKKLYTGIDFEFNQSKIALCQIAFFSKRKNKIIWVFNPTMLNSQNTLYLIKYYFISKHVIKLVHGSDSLDVPYLFHEMFAGNTEFIYSYIINVIDTRFYCEYSKTSIDFTDKKCSIYDALLYFGTITQEKYDELQSITSTMGPIQDVRWNVMNMSSYNFKYSVYDVLYLYNFYKDINKKAKQETPKLYNSYMYIAEITKFVFLEKYKITDILVYIKQKIDPINNYLIKIKNKNITLITVYNNIIKDMIVKSDKLTFHINHYFGINYFKTHLSMLFKFITYSILLDSYIIYKNKDSKYIDKFDMHDLFDRFKDIHQYKIRTLLKHFYTTSLARIQSFMREFSMS
jgi:hypothetical protein